jgi:hypothetical protein
MSLLSRKIPHKQVHQALPGFEIAFEQFQLRPEEEVPFREGQPFPHELVN